MNFEFATARRIIFGAGKLNTLPELASSLGQRAAFITGSNAERIAPVFIALKRAGANPAAFSISEEPTTTRIATIAEQARSHGCDYVVAFGGGSVIDAGKAVAALLTNTKDLIEYLEVIGNGAPFENDPAPCVAIPTTAGTGAEVTRNAVLLSPEHQVKVSMRHPGMLPAVALVDPELTLSMPPEVTASTGLDAFTQLLEAFVSIKSTPITDGICREGLKYASRSLHRAYSQPENLEARTDMALASLFGGLALANAGLGAVHGFAGPLGGMYKAPHGMICAALLPAACQVNIRSLRERSPEDPALTKYLEATRIVTGNNNASFNDGMDWIENLCIQLQVPGLASLGIKEEHFPEIITKSSKASSMKGNPIALTDRELEDILFAALSDIASDNRPPLYP
ncbi:MAG: iron-containing alcohol dehydrogenase [Pontiellaceae bacterium]|nr:iron-containing alcohol dehydrogenase [Pontiellaceae bacterium]MBN2784192.1 iron-containing alcohol dehydrogenase [Pontiellaceae bacterium]